LSGSRKIIPAICIAALCAFVNTASPAYCAETAKVLRVMDADVLRVTYKGKVEYVRLAGIEINETPSDNETIKTTLSGNLNLEFIVSLKGKNKPVIMSEKNRLAVLFTRRTVKPGDEVVIEIDGRRRDEHKMLLCYVFLPKGKFLNEELVKAGFAKVSEEPYVRYRERLMSAYTTARKEKRGGKTYSVK